jgi:hypothetical protein
MLCEYVSSPGLSQVAGHWRQIAACSAFCRHQLSFIQVKQNKISWDKFLILR